MSTASDGPSAHEPRRFAIRLPRPLWIGLVGAALFYAGWSAYRIAGEESLLRVHSNLLVRFAAGDFDGAYELMADEYRSNRGIEDFRSDFWSMPEGRYVHVTRPKVLSFLPYSAEVYAFEDPGFFTRLNGPSFLYVKERGQWRFTGKRNVYLD